MNRTAKAKISEKLLSKRNIRLIALVPLFFYSAVYLYIRWLEQGYIPMVKTPLGQILLVLMSAYFIFGAIKARSLPARILLVALGLMFLGLPISIISRQEQSSVFLEGQTDLLGGRKISLKTVKVAAHPNILLERDQIAEVLVDGNPTRFGVFAWRRGFSYYHTFRFGFSPQIRAITNGQPEPWLDMLFGVPPIGDKYNDIVPRRPPPRLMLGVGTYPPELETVFEDGDRLFFLRLEKGTLGGVRRNLMLPEYHMWLMDGRLQKPQYRLMVWRKRKRIINRILVPGQKITIEPGRQLEIGRLKYWAEIDKIDDYGRPIFVTGFLMLVLGLFITPLWLVVVAVKRVIALIQSRRVVLSKTDDVLASIEESEANSTKSKV